MTIKKCICGEEPLMENQNNSNRDNKAILPYIVMCEKCFTHGEYSASFQKAIRSWNNEIQRQEVINEIYGCGDIK